MFSLSFTFIVTLTLKYVDGTYFGRTIYQEPLVVRKEKKNMKALETDQHEAYLYLNLDTI